MTSLEVLFSSAEFEALAKRALSRTTCVVFDILRATSSMITALANGATAIVPVGEIFEALDIKSKRPEVLLAGEREGFRITRKQTGSIDFDLGNSPREFTRELVTGKTIVMTTTNGTRALRACAKAQAVLPAAFLNMEATARHILTAPPANLLLICSGTHEEASLEDTLAAGALIERLATAYEKGHVADSAQIARMTYARYKSNLLEAMNLARNGRRLLAIPELAADVPFCLNPDQFSFLAQVNRSGEVVGIL
jgi:2-phosphosulfolactate phosphatase